MEFATELLNESGPIYKMALSGKVFAEGSQELETELLNTIKKGAKYIVLDLSQLDLIDSSGLSALITAIKAIKSEKKGAIVAHSLSESIKKIFGLTKIDKFVKCFATADEAVAHVNGLG